MNCSWTEEKVKEGLARYHDLRYSWSTILSEKPKMWELRKAAVLIPLYIKDGEVYVWLTKRSDNVTHDRGHVSFPGGMKDDTDETAVDTCLREAHEEIGMDHHVVETIVELLPRVNIRQILITPIVGLVSADFIPQPNSEVDVAFSLPLFRFLEEERYRSSVYDMRGQKGTIHFFEDDVNGETIVTWGLTATLCIELAVGLFQQETEFDFVAGDKVTCNNPFAGHELYLKNLEKIAGKGPDILSSKL